MLWIGLTGGIGCGKSTVAERLRSKGIPVVDADKYARQALLPQSPPFAVFLNVFGSDYLTAQGQVDRKRLADEVFHHPSKRRVLEGIIHPWISDQVKKEREQLMSAHSPVAFYDIPLLFEKQMQDRFDFIVVVASPESVQYERLRARNKWSDEEIKSRLASQVSIDEKVKQAHWVIRNDGTLEDLYQQVDQMLLKLPPSAVPHNP